MEIVKIGENIWQIAVIRQIRQSFFTTKVFYYTVVTNEGSYYCTSTLL